ncbi:MAG: hemolysin family protein [Candidatus Kariarchaeaceae archaeon]|jgi:CBS domain containing-hemolysin-like protein
MTWIYESEKLDSGAIQDSMVNFFDLILILAFIILNGFFVTAEFSLLRIPKTKIQSFAKNGGTREEKLKAIYDNIDLYIASLQIGITLTTLVIGWIGIGFFDEISGELFSALGLNGTTSNIISFMFGLFLILLIHSIFGQMAPIMVTNQQVETVALNISIPTYYYTKIVHPVTRLYRRSTYYFLKLLRFHPENVVYKEIYSEDELKMLIQQSQEEGEIDQTEQEMIERIFDFTDTTAKSILTPRYKMVAFPIDVNVDEIIQNARETGYSRFPIYETKLDEIRGFVHVKDIITANTEDVNFDVSRILREVVVVHEGMMLDVLLRKMQKKRSQLAIIVDEYGSVEGLATIEDVIEEIVGEIDDEFDEETTNLVQLIDDDKYLINADISLDQFNASFEVDLIIDEAVTLAGFILEHLDDIPAKGVKLNYNDCEFEVLEMDGNRIAKVQLLINNTTNGPNTAQDQ